MRERPRWRETLIGDDALEPRTFVELVKRCLAELGFVEGAPAGPLRPMCHLVKSGSGAWVEGSFPSRAARDLASVLASASGTSVWVLEAVARDDGSMRSLHQEIDVSAERVLPDTKVEPSAVEPPPLGPPPLQPLPPELATREGPDGADPNVVAEQFAREALRWVWGQVRTTPTHSRISLGHWSPPRAGFQRVAGVTDPAEAAFRSRIVGAKEKAIVEGPGGKPALRLVLADGSRQLRVLNPRELAWARKVLGS